MLGFENLLKPKNTDTSGLRLTWFRPSRFPIIVKVLVAIWLVSLIPLTGLVLSTLRLRQTVHENVRLTLEKTSLGLAAQVNTWTDLNLRVLRQAATHPDIVSMDANKQKPFLVSMENSYEWTYRILTVGLDGYILSRSSGQEIYDEQGNPTFFRGDRIYFTEILEGKPFAQQTLISRSTGKPAHCLSVPIRSSGGSELKGVLIECSFLEVLSKAITDLRIGQTGFAFLLDENGQLIAHGGNPDLVSENLQDFSSYPARNGVLHQPSRLDIDGRDVLAYSTKLGLGWTLIVQQDAKEAYLPLKQAQQNALLLVLISTLLVVIVAYILTRRLVIPLERLTQDANRISLGDLDSINKELHRSDEIGALAKAIERLRISVKMMLAELSKQQKDEF